MRYQRPFGRSALRIDTSAVPAAMDTESGRKRGRAEASNVDAGPASKSGRFGDMTPLSQADSAAAAATATAPATSTTTRDEHELPHAFGGAHVHIPPPADDSLHGAALFTPRYAMANFLMNSAPYHMPKHGGNRDPPSLLAAESTRGISPSNRRESARSRRARLLRFARRRLKRMLHDQGALLEVLSCTGKCTSPTECAPSRLIFAHYTCCHSRGACRLCGWANRQCFPALTQMPPNVGSTTSSSSSSSPHAAVVQPAVTTSRAASSSGTA